MNIAARPRILRIMVIDDETGSHMLNIDEHTCSILAALNGTPGMFRQRFAPVRSVSIVIMVEP